MQTMANFSQRNITSGNKLQECTLCDSKIIIITWKGFILWNHNRNHVVKVSKQNYLNYYKINTSINKESLRPIVSFKCTSIISFSHTKNKSSFQCSCLDFAFVINSSSQLNFTAKIWQPSSHMSQSGFGFPFQYMNFSFCI